MSGSISCKATSIAGKTVCFCRDGRWSRIFHSGLGERALEPIAKLAFPPAWPMPESDEEDYCYYGTALVDEIESKAGAFRKPVQDAATTRALPIWQQEPTDEQGRKRFHGAFTGGFSAGYFNTVGSAEGFEPATFKSSRSDRNAGAKKQSIDDYLDEDELEERKRTHLQVQIDYDTFGASAAEAALNAARRDADSRPSIIPGGIVEEVVVPVANSIGMRLLQRMGWRPGRGIGTSTGTKGADSAGSKWGTVSGVSLENTPLYVVLPKQDVHGLGFDPFKDAEDFRELKRRKTEARVNRLTAEASGTFAGTRSGGPSRVSDLGRRARGVAFGTGVLDEDDALGGDMDDYVDEAFEPEPEDADGSDGDGIARGLLGKSGVAIGALFGAGDGSKRAGPLRALPIAGASGRRALALARQGFSYQMGGSDDEDEDGLGAPGSRPKPMLLDDRERDARPMLQSAKDLLKGGDFIPGFKKSGQQVVLTRYPAPEVPASFIARHLFAGTSPGSEVGAGLAAPPPAPLPEVAPPADLDLRKEADSLAALVARSGQAVEDLARRQVAATAAAVAAAARAEGGAQAGRIKFAFLLAGSKEQEPELAHAALYYAWLLQKIKAALASIGVVQKPAPALRQSQEEPAGGGRKRLSVDERLALLGEVPLASSWAAAAALSAAAKVADGVPSPSPGISATDKTRLLEALKGNFVKAEVQDMAADASSSQQVGLRPSGANSAAAAALLASFSGRFASGDAMASADLPAVQAPGGLQAPAAVQERNKEVPPERTSEDWRPEPLLCRRFNVPDPYHGKPQPQQPQPGSRFRSDSILLISEASAALQPDAAAPAGQLPPAPQVLPPPPPLPLPPGGPAAWAARSAPTSMPPPPPRPPGQGSQFPAARAPPSSVPSNSILPPSPTTPSGQHGAPSGTSGLLGGASGLLDAKAMALDFLATLQLDMGEDMPEIGSQGQEQQQVGVVPSPEAGTPAATSVKLAVLDRPLDLFKAIFEAEEDTEQEEDEVEAKQPEAAEEDAEPPPSAASGAVLGSEAAAATSAPVPGPAKALANALLRAQELCGARVEDAKAKAAQQALLSLPAERGLSAPPGTQDPAIQDRILSALAVLRDIKKKSRKEKKERRDKKGKKWKKSAGVKKKKSRKHKTEDKKKGRRDNGDSRGRGRERRDHRDSDASDDGSSSSSSESGSF